MTSIENLEFLHITENELRTKKDLRHIYSFSDTLKKQQSIRFYKVLCFNYKMCIRNEGKNSNKKENCNTSHFLFKSNACLKCFFPKKNEDYVIYSKPDFHSNNFKSNLNSFPEPWDYNLCRQEMLQEQLNKILYQM